MSTQEKRPNRNVRKPRNKPKGPSDKDKPDMKKKNTKKKEVKEKDYTKDYKYQQIKKLVKKLPPITINGLSITNLCKQLEEGNKLKAIDQYVLTFIKNQPENSIYLSFIITPSDPEFPFDLEMLKLNLCIPGGYPYKKDAKPSIYVLNEEIPRGYAANIEIGYRKIVEMALNNKQDEDIELVDGKGLLSQLKTLDKYLEMFLMQEKRKTIKFVKGKKPISQAPSPSPSPSPSPVPETKISPPKTSPQPSSTPTQSRTIENPQRKQFINQLSSKLKNDVKLFNKSRNYERFKIQLPINTKYDLPEIWLNYGSIEILLTIPREYPQLPMNIEIFNKFLEKMNRLGDFRSYETNLVENFNQFAFKDTNIVSTLNYLSNNLSIFCLDREDFINYNKLCSSI